MDAQDVLDGVLGLLDASGLTEQYRNDVPARVALEIPLDAPANTTLRHAAKAPHGEIRRYPARHFDIYIGEHFERIVADQLAFLGAHVPTATT
jgi:hypothetical protein